MDTFEILAICGTAFGAAALLLFVVTLLVMLRNHHGYGFHGRHHHHHGGHVGMQPVDELSDGDDESASYNAAYVGQEGGALVGGKHKRKTHVHVHTRSGNPTDWRPFWPLFICIVFVTLSLIGVPLLIWLAGGTHHHIHHHGDDSSSSLGSSAASSASGSII